MASPTKLVKMPDRPSLSPGLQEFIDNYVVPSLLKKYLAEEEKEATTTNLLAPYSPPAPYSRRKRHRGSE